MPWTTTSSDLAYSNQWIRVLHDQVIRPDGGAGIYGVVETVNPAVFIVPLDEDDRVLLVHVDRYTTGPQWEVPAGGTDGQDPLQAARRELAEETGLHADEWTMVGRHWTMNGVARAEEYVYLAQGLTATAEAETAEEGITEQRRVAWSDVMAMISSGEITDGETVAALMHAAIHLGRVH